MSDQIEFVLELTREEALALQLLWHSSWGSGLVYSTITRISDALEKADPTLRHAQLRLWEAHRPHFELKDTVPLPKDWI